MKKLLTTLTMTATVGLAQAEYNPRVAERAFAQMRMFFSEPLAD